MPPADITVSNLSFYSSSIVFFKNFLELLIDGSMQGCEHGDIESFLQTQSNELFRLIFQDELNRQSAEESVNSQIQSSRIRHHTQRQLTTLFGDIIVPRMSYCSQGKPSQFPFDKQLNLSKIIPNCFPLLKNYL